MLVVVRREFTVEMPLEQAWEHLARAEQWPSWAKHIKQVKVEPPGPVGAHSTGVIHLRNGIKSAFKMTEFNPHRNWTWKGPLLWFTVRYDHAFEAVTPSRTKMTWIVEGEGFGVSVFGRLFAKVYNRQLDRAIPALVEEMNGAAEAATWEQAAGDPGFRAEAEAIEAEFAAADRETWPP